MGIQAAGGYFALNSDGVTPFQHPVELDRNLARAMFRQSGCLRGGDWTVAPTGTNQQVSISTGSGFVNGQESAQQGGYVGWSDASENKTFGAPSGSPRIDTLLLRAYDPQYGTLPSGTCRMQWDIVAGTPAATPAPQPDSAFISTGGQWVPGAWMKWAEVRINPGDTVIPSGQIYLPGSVVSGIGTTWSQRFARGSGATILCTAASRPASPQVGDMIYETDTQRFYVWNGAAWFWPWGRGLVGGTRFNGTGNFTTGMTGAEALVTNFNTGSLTLEANRSFEIRAKVFSDATVNNTYSIFRIRDTNLVGTERIAPLCLYGLSGNIYTFDITARYETSTATTITFVLTEITTTGGTVSVRGGTSNKPCFMEVHDMGPTGRITTSSLP